MLLIVGYVIILLASVGTYAVHGSLAALWMPMEYVALLGLALGGFIAGNGTKAVTATIAALPKVFKGSHIELDEVETWSTHSIEIKASRPFTVYADGDPLTELPATIRVLPSALEMIVPGSEPS